MSRRPPVTTRGFTLLELILVMMVVFTLAAVVAPRFSEFFPSLQVRTAADRLLAWSGKARAEAALTGVRHRLVINAGAREFWIEWEPKPLKEPGKFERLLGAWDKETLPTDVVFETFKGFETHPDAPAAQYLEFDPDGSAAEASVDVANDRGDRRTLRVAAATGSASISNPNDPDAEEQP
jgi:prepilin-type N-terminal cleavage/methylation domain-containing protein